MQLITGGLSTEKIDVKNSITSKIKCANYYINSSKIKLNFAIEEIVGSYLKKEFGNSLVVKKDYDETLNTRKIDYMIIIKYCKKSNCNQ